MRRIDVFRAELHSLPLRAVLDEAESTLGRDALERLVGENGVSCEQLSASGAWVSIEFAESLFDAITRDARDPDLPARAMLRGMSLKYLEPLYPALFAFGSPGFAYAQLPRAAARWNKTGRFSIDARRRGFARIRWLPLPGAPRETKQYLCDARRVQLAQVPAAFEREAAVVAHEQCLLRGDAACVYEVRWRESSTESQGILADVIGAVAVAARGLTGGLGHDGGAGGDDSGSRFKRFLSKLRGHSDADRVRELEEAARVQEARYAELSTAKARVDAELTERRSELHETSAKLSQALERVQLLTAQAARQERFAALGSLAASVAHNVRNPLSALISGLPAMRKRILQHLDDPTSELMDVMVDCAQRIERLTLDLLDLSRIDRAANGDYAPGSGLLACARMFAARLDGGDVELDTEGVDVLAMATCRPGEINHVFMNVIDNAVRAIAGKGRIAVRGSVDSGFYVVSVSDSGPGIAAENLDRVFEPFWTTRVPGEGTGLGLAIARQIVEDHGGTISAGRSALGGAEFTIRVPLRRAERAA